MPWGQNEQRTYYNHASGQHEWLVLFFKLKIRTFGDVRISVLRFLFISGTDKRKLIVIGKSAKPRCFKNVKSLPVDYFHNKKAWMTQDIFKKWLISFDKDMRTAKRKILLFIDNCAAHGHATDMQKHLKAITLAYFPPNVTSHLQPLDQGIINSLKVQYRGQLLRSITAGMENGEDIKPLNLLEAIRIISQCWFDKVTTQTISNCFRKAGFAMQNESEIEPDNWEVQGIAALAPVFDEYMRLTNSSVNDIDVLTYAFLDQHVVATRYETDSEIVQSVIGEAVEIESSDDENSNADNIHQVDFRTAKLSITNLRSFLEQHEGICVDDFRVIDRIERVVHQTQLSNLHQTSITDFYE